MKTLTGTIRYKDVTMKFKCTIYMDSVNVSKRSMKIGQYNQDIIDLEMDRLMTRHK